jgi:hypothetical protein
MTQSVHDTTTGALRNDICSLLCQPFGFQGTIGTYDGPAQTGFRPKRREVAHQGRPKFLQGRMSYQQGIVVDQRSRLVSWRSANKIMRESIQMVIFG